MLPIPPRDLPWLMLRGVFRLASIDFICRVGERATRECDPLSPRRTGQADFPTSGSPESNIATGMRRPWTALLGLLAQLLSQQREFVWKFVSARLFLQGFDKLPFIRSGISSKRFSSPLTAALLSARPLCSTGVTPLPRSYGPLRLPARADPSVMDSIRPLGPVARSHPAGSPRFLD